MTLWSGDSSERRRTENDTKVKEYTGITWDHPRGFRALDESARRWSKESFKVRWDRQSLEQFESRSIADLSSRYDLMVLDHPHIGEAAESNCLQPAEDWCSPDRLAVLKEKAIGGVLRSYFYQGKHWALPLDAAAQVSACRLDLLPRSRVPDTWAEVCELPETNSVVLSLAGPHALLTFFSVCSALGEPPLSRNTNQLISRETGGAALEMMSKLYVRMDGSTLEFSPIQILERMAVSDSVAYCPLIFGYVNYAITKSRVHQPITFMNAPGIEPGGVPGSTLGGTGIAISRRAELSPGLSSYLLWLVEEETQRTFIPNWDGQPSLRSAWLDDQVNQRWNNFYRNTFATVEQAWVRPRFPGYIRFQTEASELLRSGLKAPTPDLLERLQTLFTRCLLKLTRDQADVTASY